MGLNNNRGDLKTIQSYNNFKNNNYPNGKFYLSKVAKDGFILDKFVELKKINKIQKDLLYLKRKQNLKSLTRHL